MIKLEMQKLISLIIILILLSSCKKQVEKELLLLDMVGKNPGEQPFKSSFNNPDTLISFGFDGKVINDNILASLTYDELDSSIIPQNSKTRQWINDFSQKINFKIKRYNDQDLQVYFLIDIFTIPKEVKNKYRNEITNKAGKISFKKPETVLLHSTIFKELFNKYPEIAGLIIRIGENYQFDYPYHTGNIPEFNSDEEHIKLINFLRNEICLKYNKKLIYRTWSFYGFHSDVNNYVNITNQIKPHKNLFFSMKHTQSDFFRTSPFNPTITTGKHKQIIEVQCQREYEGKGAHPNYIGEHVINGFPEFFSLKNSLKKSRGMYSQSRGLKDVYDNSNVNGIWTWSKGGGWGGPYITNEFWNELNTYVLSNWAKNPQKSEIDIFNEFCDRYNLNNTNKDKFRELCSLSSEGVLLGHYSKLYGTRLTWTRDDFLGGINELENVFKYIIQEDIVKKALEEKATSVRLWKKIEQLSKDINFNNESINEFIRVSSIYGRIKYEIIHSAWIVMLKGYSGDVTGVYDTLEIKNAIIKYDDLWKEFYELESSNENCPTLYKEIYFRSEVGMKQSIDKYRNL